MPFYTSIMEKTCTFLDEMIHIMLGSVVHLHDHWNKMMPFIIIDLNNSVEFRNYICWSTNDI
jgi:hypothetical protein